MKTLVKLENINWQETSYEGIEISADLCIKLIDEETNISVAGKTPLYFNSWMVGEEAEDRFIYRMLGIDYSEPIEEDIDAYNFIKEHKKEWKKYIEEMYLPCMIEEQLFPGDDCYGDLYGQGIGEFKKYAEIPEDLWLTAPDEFIVLHDMLGEKLNIKLNKF